MKPSAARRLKRVFDVIASGAALVFLAPVLAVLAVVVRSRLGSPIIYRAERIGYGSEIFTLYKLRSMTDETDDAGVPLPDGQRLTPLGEFLRRSSLDELPSLVNVLRGEMSLVGPRPFSSLYKDRYTVEQNRRHDVLPGITGWSQVNGRNNLAWEEKFALDLWYIEHWSLLLDIRILLRTVHRVVARRDVNQDGHATAPEFMGTLTAGDRPETGEETAR